MADLPKSNAGRDELRDILRLPSMTAEASIANEASDSNLRAVSYRLSMNEQWTIPAVALSQAENSSSSVAIVFGDEGKNNLAEQVMELVEAGSTVVAVDPTFFGECLSEGFPVWQQAQMVSAIGERTLGIQVAQMGTIVEWACEEFGVDKISLHSSGWNSSVIALSVCALHNDKVKSVLMSDHLARLKNLIDDHIDYENYPALFCFGLLEKFDIQELIALCSPANVKMKGDV